MADDTQMEEFIFSSGKITTLESLYKALGTVVNTQEGELKTKIDQLAGEESGLNQAALLQVQGMVQTWSITSGLATGTLRAAGDAIVKVTQNIR